MNAILSNHNLINEVTITLKEITDLLEVRHDRALKQVDMLCKEPSFGAVSKIDIAVFQKDGKINNNITTYKLNKKQTMKDMEQIIKETKEYLLGKMLINEIKKQGGSYERQ